VVEGEYGLEFLCLGTCLPPTVYNLQKGVCPTAHRLRIRAHPLPIPQRTLEKYQVPQMTNVCSDMRFCQSCL
jgi:hypothetical protein